MQDIIWSLILMIYLIPQDIYWFVDLSYLAGLLIHKALQQKKSTLNFVSFINVAILKSKL